MASIRDHLQTLTDTVGAVRVLQRSGALDLTKPRELATAVKRSKTLGAPATIMLHGAEEHPDAPALTDERGTLTFGELNDNAKALANELLAIGLTPGSVIGVLARDHRGLLTVLAASGFAGVRLPMMNTGFGKTQFAEVAERERVQVMFYDEEFIDLLDGLPDSLPRYLTWVDGDRPIPEGVRTLDAVVDGGNTSMPPEPDDVGGLVILTSGTTGLPKGAQRGRFSPFTSA
ncbi:MAG: AMP-binding protein, partial [Mycobacterium sp.]|nr:AMP-binding protein [Mycobacterium sp.]